MAIKKIHFIGIKGVGMAAMAIYAKQKGWQVSGSDTLETFVTDKILKDALIEVKPFAEASLDKPDLVVSSAAYGRENTQIKFAKKKHLEIKNYSEMLGEFSRDSTLIAVSGIHGKTTTAALISFLLKSANLDPSYIIGSGNISMLGASGHYGKGEYFVVEADEYRKSPDDSTPKFFDLSPQIEIITSIEMDHPDIFPSEEDVYNAFYKFACKLPRKGFIVLCNDYPKTKKLKRSLVDRNFENYGFSQDSSWQIIENKQDLDGMSFSIFHNGENYGPFRLRLFGEANSLNATAAIITALKIGISQKVIKKNLANFRGVQRRFEKIGQIDDIVLLDDYAHHPRSIAMTLKAAHEKYPQAKIWCIFQPHTYSRTKELLKDFGQSFKDADKVIVTEIYSSARESNPTVSGADLASEIKKHQRSVKFIEKNEKIIQEVIDNVDSPAIIITMGAGDIYKLGNQILDGLKNERKDNN